MLHPDVEAAREEAERNRQEAEARYSRVVALARERLPASVIASRVGMSAASVRRRLVSLGMWPPPAQEG